MDCNHKNYKRSDNRLENLEYCTREENNSHRDRKPGAKKNIPRGEENYNSKLTTLCVLKIFKLKRKGLSCRRISELFEVSERLVRGVVKRERWKHVDIPPELLS